MTSINNIIKNGIEKWLNDNNNNNLKLVTVPKCPWRYIDPMAFERCNIVDVKLLNIFDNGILTVQD